MRIRLPGGKFMALDGAGSIPVGAEVDVTKGRVALTAASDLGNGRQTAQFYGGVLKLAQKRATKPVTELRLSTSAALVEKVCGTATSRASAAAPRPPRSSARAGAPRRSTACGATARAASRPSASTARRPCAARSGCSRTAATERHLRRGTATASPSATSSADATCRSAPGRATSPGG